MPERKEIEGLWRARVAAAKLRLDAARKNMKQMERDFNSGSEPGIDGILRAASPPDYSTLPARRSFQSALLG